MRLGASRRTADRTAKKAAWQGWPIFPRLVAEVSRDSWPGPNPPIPNFGSTPLCTASAVRAAPRLPVLPVAQRPPGRHHGPLCPLSAPPCHPMPWAVTFLLLLLPRGRLRPPLPRARAVLTVVTRSLLSPPAPLKAGVQLHQNGIALSDHNTVAAPQTTVLPRCSLHSRRSAH